MSEPPGSDDPPTEGPLPGAVSPFARLPLPEATSPLHYRAPEFILNKTD